MLERVDGVTRGALARIAAGLSPQNDAEREVIGLEREKVVDHLMALAPLGFTEMALLDGEPVAAFGMNARDGYNNTWFIATKPFFDLGAAGVRYARGRVIDFRRRGLPLRSVSFSPLAVAPKWFKVLGFVEDHAQCVDGAKVFVYN